MLTRCVSGTRVQVQPAFDVRHSWKPTDRPGASTHPWMPSADIRSVFALAGVPCRWAEVFSRLKLMPPLVVCAIALHR